MSGGIFFFLGALASASAMILAASIYERLDKSYSPTAIAFWQWWKSYSSIIVFGLIFAITTTAILFFSVGYYSPIGSVTWRVFARMTSFSAEQILYGALSGPIFLVWLRYFNKLEISDGVQRKHIIITLVLVTLIVLSGFRESIDRIFSGITSVEIAQLGKVTVGSSSDRDVSNRKFVASYGEGQPLANNRTDFVRQSVSILNDIVDPRVSQLRGIGTTRISEAQAKIGLIARDAEYLRITTKWQKRREIPIQQWLENVDNDVQASVDLLQRFRGIFSCLSDHVSIFGDHRFFLVDVRQLAASLQMMRLVARLSDTGDDLPTGFRWSHLHGMSRELEALSEYVNFRLRAVREPILTKTLEPLQASSLHSEHEKRFKDDLLRKLQKGLNGCSKPRWNEFRIDHSDEDIERLIRVRSISDSHDWIALDKELRSRAVISDLIRHAYRTPYLTLVVAYLYAAVNEVDSSVVLLTEWTSYAKAHRKKIPPWFLIRVQIEISTLLEGVLPDYKNPSYRDFMKDHLDEFASVIGATNLANWEKSCAKSEIWEKRLMFSYFVQVNKLLKAMNDPDVIDINTIQQAEQRAATPIECFSDVPELAADISAWRAEFQTTFASLVLTWIARDEATAFLGALERRQLLTRARNALLLATPVLEEAWQRQLRELESRPAYEKIFSRPMWENARFEARRLLRAVQHDRI